MTERSRSSPTPVWWRAALLGAPLAAGAYFALPAGVAQGVYYDALGVAAAAAVLLGARRHRPSHLVAWYLLSAGIACFVAGDAIWDVYELGLGIESPFPSFADASYIAAYPALAAALLLLIRRQARRDVPAMIDASLIALGMAVVSWAFLMQPYAGDASMSLVARAISVAYPLMDVLLLAVAARFMLGPAVRTAAFRLLGASLLVQLAGDVAYAGLELGGAYHTGHAVDATWLLSHLLLGLGALHPSMRALSEPAPQREARLTRVRVGLLAVALLGAPVTLAVQAARGASTEVPVIVVGAAALSMLVLARMTGLVREVAAKAERLRAQSEELARAMGDLSAVQAERGRLLDRTLRAAEQERKRVAVELHDGPLQRLTGLGYRLERARMALRRGDASSGAACVEEAQRSLADELRGLRHLMSELRPPALDERGLAAAIADEAEAFGRRTAVDASVDVRLDGRLDPELETVIYRVTQEALANVAAHARARHVWVTLRVDGGVVALDVRDDGGGFDVSRAPRFAAEGHFGLVAMRERVEMAGGRFEVASSPDLGTSVRAELSGRASSPAIEAVAS